MMKRACTRQDLLDRWRGIDEELEEGDLPPAKQRVVRHLKEEWFAEAFNFLINAPVETHLWCSCWDLMGPLLETFHNYFEDKNNNSPLKQIWRRVSQEMDHCTQCICQYHQAQETYNSEYEYDTVGPLLKVLRSLDEERVTKHIKDMNRRITGKEYDPERHGTEVVTIMFEVLMFPILLDDQSLVTEFESFIEAIDNSHEVSLAGSQQYPGVYALLFLKNARIRAIGLRLAGCMGKMRRATDLEPLQPLLRKYMEILEIEVLPSHVDSSRPRVQLERITVWLGLKALLGFLEAPAFEEGILERYPIFLSIVMNHVSDDTPEFSYAVTCLRLFFEMLGCKLWLRTTLSPSVMRNTLLGQCFHTRNEKSHKEIFDLFLPFLQSLEALQDGEFEKQRRHFLYFLLHQVTHSSNFSFLMRKNACKIALLIIQRGYKMNPPCPPFECSHMWGPSLVSSLKDSSLHSSLRQPAFDLIQTIIVSDHAALVSSELKKSVTSADDMEYFSEFYNDEDELPISHDSEERGNSCWDLFSFQSKLVARECKDWRCIPMLWLEIFIDMDPSVLPISISKAIIWALSHFSVVEPDINMEMKLSVSEWLASNAGEISHSFGWEVPKGYDDGGYGNESKNSVKASLMFIPLIKTFKRCAAHFMTIMEQHGLQKQWTWEPRMAESLILLLIDPNDTVRQANRIILEHISKKRGLTPGLQFLCSSADSLSAVYLGLKYATKQVQLHLDLKNFPNHHHLFFIVRKLLKEVVASSEKPPSTSEGNLYHSRLPAEGGFLRQPCFVRSQVADFGGSSNVVDVKSWKKFSCLLSAIMWPFILKCLVEGTRFINNKDSQMTCVRLLETVPVIFERIASSPSLLEQTSNFTSSVFSDLKWLYDLVEWGRSSLAVVIRHWKQSMLSLTNLLEGFCNVTTECAINDIRKIMGHDIVGVDDLKEQLSQISLSISKEDICINERKPPKAKHLYSQPPYPERKVLVPELLSSKEKTEIDLEESAAFAVSSVVKLQTNQVIIVSDDEDEKVHSSNLISLSSNASEKALNEVSTGKGILSIDDQIQRESFDDGASPGTLESVPCNEKVRNSNQKITSTLPTSKAISHTKKSSATLVNLESDAGRQGKRNLQDGNDSLSAFKAESPNDKRNIAIEELVSDAAEDPLEKAFSFAKFTQVMLSRPCVAVPKRKVVQLQMPSGDKPSFLSRTRVGTRRLKPARLDNWYRPILELDYFFVVALSSNSEDKNIASSHLKEVPMCFNSPQHYVEIFRPLVLEEFKAQLHNSYIDASSSDDMCCVSLSVLSVERIDDFHLVRGSPEERDSLDSRGYSENDLVLLTKEPLQRSAQSLHALGKVERREKSNKNRSTILTIRFYLQSGLSRLNKVRRFLTERSKWCISRIMSMTPQLREFQALSSLNDIPLMPVILNPVDSSSSNVDLRSVQLAKLPSPLQKTLKLSFNDSQLQAISVAIGNQGSRKAFDLSLIQGPPGTGKTRTIVAIVSSLLALGPSTKGDASKTLNNSAKSEHSALSTARARASEAAGIARAWQDAALARQMIHDEVRDDSGSAPRPSKQRVLICAQSNAAVDELVSRINCGLYGNDGKMYKPYLVRVGNVKTVHPTSLPFFIDTLVEQRFAECKCDTNSKKDADSDSSASLRAKLEKAVDNIRLLESMRAKLRDPETETKNSSDDRMPKMDDGKEMSEAAIEAKLNSLYTQKKAICGDIAAVQTREKRFSEESKFLKIKIRKSIIREAEILVTTLSGCGGDIYGVCSDYASSCKFGNFSENSLFDAVVIDEAAQALEPATLIPLQLLKSNGTKCIMVGDPKQLPATVLSNVASKFMYECSMFERLQRAGHPVAMLTEQYRMHPEISKFPSLHFYENKLLNGTTMVSKSAPFHENSCLGPYVFYDITDGHERHGKGSGSLSLRNEPEAEAAVEIFKFLRDRYLSEFSGGRIGIVTPYRSQLSILRSRFSSEFGPNIAGDMEFNTVDGFQGREVDILLLSTVRASGSNARDSGVMSNSIGFVADVRRMNVALTRARLSLWILGNARTLQRNAHWAALIKDAKERGLFLSISRPYKSNFQKLSLSRKKVDSSSLDSLSAQHKQDDKFQGGRYTDKRKAKSSNQESEKRTTRLEPGFDMKQKLSSENEILSERHMTTGPKSSGDACSVSKNGILADCLPEGKMSQRKKESSSGDRHVPKVKGTCHPVRSRPVQSDVQLEETLASKIKTKKEKSVSQSSASRNVSQPESRVSQSCTGGQQENELGSTTKSYHLDTTPRDLISSRKRQRDAVDALLSSALISSKKPVVSSKPAPAKRSHSPSNSAKPAIRQALSKKERLP